VILNHKELNKPRQKTKDKRQKIQDPRQKNQEPRQKTKTAEPIKLQISF
jgi:hypothetical protein